MNIITLNKERPVSRSTSRPVASRADRFFFENETRAVATVSGTFHVKGGAHHHGFRSSRFLYIHMYVCMYVCAWLPQNRRVHVLLASRSCRLSGRDMSVLPYDPRTASSWLFRDRTKRVHASSSGSLHQTARGTTAKQS